MIHTQGVAVVIRLVMVAVLLNRSLLLLPPSRLGGRARAAAIIVAAVRAVGVHICNTTVQCQSNSLTSVSWEGTGRSDHHHHHHHHSSSLPPPTVLISPVKLIKKITQFQSYHRTRRRGRGGLWDGGGRGGEKRRGLITLE